MCPGFMAGRGEGGQSLIQPLEQADQIELNNIKGGKGSTDHIAHAPWLHGGQGGGGAVSNPAFGAGWPNWTGIYRMWEGQHRPPRACALAPWRAGEGHKQPLIQPLEQADQIELDYIKGGEGGTDHLAHAPWLHGGQGGSAHSHGHVAARVAVWRKNFDNLCFSKILIQNRFKNLNIQLPTINICKLQYSW